MAQINKLISKGYNKTSAVTKVLRKHKTAFEDLFETEILMMKKVTRKKVTSMRRNLKSNL
jgi:hypothetical protein